jgi:hypothetical protein
MDLSKIKAKKKDVLPVDPYEIFRKNISRMSESGVNDLWAGQVDALRDWHTKRSSHDVCLVLNTGAGKTLLGALVGQSLVNETQGKVLFACGSIQLVEQTREKFESYGLRPTTYVEGAFNNNNYDRGQAVCITTYQALFNGRSRFFAEDINAIIFDDAHTAEGMIKNHFTLDIRQNSLPGLYNNLCVAFQPYFKELGRSGTFSEICAGQNSKTEMVHPSWTLKNQATIRSLLEEGNIAGEKDTLFAWAHLKDHLDVCAILISSGAIQLVPAFVPVTHLPYFCDHIRRVYLTATMLGEDAFVRTFGRSPQEIIRPDTPAGQCERLILFPGMVETIADDRMAAQELVAHKKALIIAPNKAIARCWSDHAETPSPQEFPAVMQEFKAANDARKIVAAARYDGIDLPGDTCRVLVLDGLPMGSGLLDKYQWESLKLVKSLRSIIACRVVQSMGRISRGMSDFGVVIIVDREYVKWLNQSINQSSLPEFIQKQLSLGCEISSQATGYRDVESVVEQCLSRDSQWLDVYEEYMDTHEPSPPEESRDQWVQFARAEVLFAEYLWDRRYEDAAKSLSNVLDMAFRESDVLGAWYAQWIGHCHELAGDQENAHMLYRRAIGAARSLPRTPTLTATPGTEELPEQIKEMAASFENAGGSSVRAPRNMARSLQGLRQGTSTNSTEESLRALGQYLGLDSTRPDKENSAGPDVLWIYQGTALCIEAKSGKKVTGSYSKRDVGQMMNHVQWVREEYPDVRDVIPVFVGPALPLSESANPAYDMFVAPLEVFERLSDELQAAFEDVAAQAMPINLAQHLLDFLGHRPALRWPDGIQHIASDQLRKGK